MSSFTAPELHSLLELSEARKAFLRALCASEIAWQEYQYQVGLYDNGLGHVPDVAKAYRAATGAHQAIESAKQCMAAKASQCEQAGLDIRHIRLTSGAP
jgi:hypothetical protein